MSKIRTVGLSPHSPYPFWPTIGSFLNPLKGIFSRHDVAIALLVDFGPAASANLSGCTSGTNRDAHPPSSTVFGVVWRTVCAIFQHVWPIRVHWYPLRFVAHNASVRQDSDRIHHEAPPWS